MREKFIQMTSGWIPVSVMCLLAIALVTGQASANLAAADPAVPPVSVTAQPDKVDQMRLWVDAYLDLHDHVEITFDAAFHAPAKSWRWQPERAEGIDHE